MPVAFRDRRPRLREPPLRIRGPRLPVLPARQILLKLQPRPTVVPILKQHPAIELIQIGGGHRGRKCGPRDSKNFVHQRLRALNHGGRRIALPTLHQAFSLPIHRRQSLHRLRIPGVFRFIAHRCRWRGRRGAAGKQRDQSPARNPGSGPSPEFQSLLSPYALLRTSSCSKFQTRRSVRNPADAMRTNPIVAIQNLDSSL